MKRGLVVSFMLVCFLFTTSISANAYNDRFGIPIEFYQDCLGEGREISCVYVKDVLEIHLFYGTSAQIPESQDEALIWKKPLERSNIIAVLAHDHLAGARFSELEEEQKIFLIWTDGTVEEYVVTEHTMWRDVRDWEVFAPWDGNGREVSVQFLGQKIYRLPNGNQSGFKADTDKLVLQTCINRARGVRFIIAEKNREIYYQGTN